MPHPATTQNLSGTALKWLALATMLLDHIGAVVMDPLRTAANAPAWLPLLYEVLRGVGRVSFPLYCFLLVEGLLHTRDCKRYLLRLAVFALVSEPAYDIAFQKVWYDPTDQNVFFTLALGLAAAWWLQAQAARPPLAWTGALLCALAAQALHTDYGFLGVVLVCLFYALHGRPAALCVAVAAWLSAGDAAVILARWGLDGTLAAYGWQPCFNGAVRHARQEVLGAFALLFTAQYNGQRGRGLPKYFFYAFYPAHLLVLAGVAGVLQLVG